MCFHLQQFPVIEKNYLFYDFLYVKLIDRRDIVSRQFSLFEKDYEYFETGNQPDKYDLIIDIGRFSPPDHGYLIENDKFLCSDTYIYSEKRYKFARFSYLIRFLPDNSIYANIFPNFFGNRVFHHLLLDYLINIKMSQKGFSNIHAAAITQNDEAIIISGPGGAGKTSFTLYCVGLGCRILGDDRVFLRDGMVSEFPECPGISSANSGYIRQYLSLKARCLLGINAFVRLLSCGYVGSLLSCSFKDIFDEQFLGRKAKLKTILILQPGTTFKVEKIDKNAACHYLMLNQQFEDRFITEMIFNYSFINCGNQLLQYLKEYESRLSKNLSGGLEAYFIEVPAGNYVSVNLWLKKRFSS